MNLLINLFLLNTNDPTQEYPFIHLIIKKQLSKNKMHTPIQLSLTQQQYSLTHKFGLYLKKTSFFYNNLQSLKRQLASIINSIDYSIPFSAFDVDKKGCVSQKNIQLLLMQNKYFVKPGDIDRYFKKYVHGKQFLSYEDIVECLVPHSDYILMASTAKKKSQYLCKRAQNQITKQIVSLIVNTEISHIKTAHLMLQQLTGSSLRVGAQLWRYLDTNHNNQLTFQTVYDLCLKYGIEVTQSEWKAFINWHFRTHKAVIRRSDFMTIFDSHVVNKRNGADCNYENFVQSKIFKKTGQIQRAKLATTQLLTKSRINKVSQSLPRPQSSQQQKQSEPSFINPQQFVPGQKRLLYTKIGYKAPENLIKMSEIV